MAVGIFNKYVQPALLTTFSKPYNIAGDVMEKRGGECEMLWVLRTLIPCSSSLQPKVENMKSQDRGCSTVSAPSSSTVQSERGSKEGTGPGTGRSDECNNNNNNNNNRSDVLNELDTDVNTRRFMNVRKLLDGRLSSSARTEVRVKSASFCNPPNC